MEFRVREIRPEDAAEIGRWRYPGFYSTYDFDGETATSASGFVAVDDRDGAFVGYGCFGAEGRVPGQEDERGVLDVGAGLAPSRMHRGSGPAFALALLIAARERHPKAATFRVAILDTNVPSQRVCVRLGFRPTRELVNRNGRFIEFRRPVWERVRGTVVAGHGVAGPDADDERFPGGTLAMQLTHFATRGFDLDDAVEALHPATINLAVGRVIEPRVPRATLRDVRWHPTVAEDFSFMDCRLVVGDATPTPGLVYWPHPETKPDHAQPPDVLEVLTAHLEGIAPGAHVQLDLDPGQLRLGPTIRP